MIKLWTERSVREKVLIGTAGLIVLAMAVVYLVYRPLVDYRDRAARSYAGAMAMMREVEANAAKADAMQTVTARADNIAAGSVRRQVGISARQRGISITRLQPARQGGLNVWVDTVAPGLFYDWLVELYERTGIVVSKATISKNPSDGTIRAQLLLVGGASA